MLQHVRTDLAKKIFATMGAWTGLRKNSGSTMGAWTGLRNFRFYYGEEGHPNFFLSPVQAPIVDPEFFLRTVQADIVGHANFF